MPHDFSVYHVNDEYSFTSTEVPVSAAERRLLEVRGSGLPDFPGTDGEKGQIQPEHRICAHGSGLSAVRNSVPEPEDLRPIPHPRIGYLGYLKKQLDWSLLLELSAIHPQWSFVFVGPKRAHPEIRGPLEQMSSSAQRVLSWGKAYRALGRVTRSISMSASCPTW